MSWFCGERILVGKIVGGGRLEFGIGTLGVTTPLEHLEFSIFRTPLYLRLESFD